MYVRWSDAHRRPDLIHTRGYGWKMCGLGQCHPETVALDQRETPTAEADNMTPCAPPSPRRRLLGDHNRGAPGSYAALLKRFSGCPATPWSRDVRHKGSSSEFYSVPHHPSAFRLHELQPHLANCLCPSAAILAPANMLSRCRDRLHCTPQSVILTIACRWHPSQTTSDRFRPEWGDSFSTWPGESGTCQLSTCHSQTRLAVAHRSVTSCHTWGTTLSSSK